MGRVSRRNGRGAVPRRPPRSPGSPPIRSQRSPTRTPASWRVVAAERVARSFAWLFRLALIRERSLRSKREGKA
jgi:hypothetical protein